MSAQAQEGSVNVGTAADSAKLGGEFRSEFLYDNNMLSKEDGMKDPKAATGLQVQAVNVKLSGLLNKSTEYAFRFNLLNPGPDNGGPLQYGYGTHWFSDVIGFSFGRMKVLQGGWDQLDGSFRDHASGAYRGVDRGMGVKNSGGNLPFRDYEDMAALHIKAAGKVTLQILNDRNPSTGAYWATTQHPTYDLGWQGDFGGIMPLIDVGTYDNQKSLWWDVGVKAKLAGIDASLDVGQNRHARKGADSSGKAKADIDTGTNVALRAGYEIAAAAKPWLYFSTYDNKEATDSVAGTKDVKYNSIDMTGTAPVYDWNDNGQTIGVGVDMLSLGKNFTPYLAVVDYMGKWEDPAKPDATKSHSDLLVRLGVLGEF
jgi:hypothetical protein